MNDMGKSTELKNTTTLVKAILETDIKARSSDDYLYIKVCERINPIAVHIPFKDMLLKRKEWGIPGFETVRRTRQKIQEENADLGASDNVEGQRLLNEEAFREYALNGGV